jgi:hypothetical protein
MSKREDVAGFDDLVKATELYKNHLKEIKKEVTLSAGCHFKPDTVVKMRKVDDIICSIESCIDSFSLEKEDFDAACGDIKEGSLTDFEVLCQHAEYFRVKFGVLKRRAMENVKRNLSIESTYQMRGINGDVDCIEACMDSFLDCKERHAEYEKFRKFMNAVARAIKEMEKELEE